MNAAYIEFPYAVEEEFGTKGQVKVQATFDGHAYRGSLANMGQGCHCLGITQKIRAAIGKGPGDTIHVELQKDATPRIVIVPEDLATLLKKNEEAKTFFESLSYTHRKEYVHWIESAKKAETRERRLTKTIDMLANNVKHP